MSTEHRNRGSAHGCIFMLHAYFPPGCTSVREYMHALERIRWNVRKENGRCDCNCNASVILPSRSELLFRDPHPTAGTLLRRSKTPDFSGNRGQSFGGVGRASYGGAAFVDKTRAPGVTAAERFGNVLRARSTTTVGAGTVTMRVMKKK